MVHEDAKWRAMLLTDEAEEEKEEEESSSCCDEPSASLSSHESGVGTTALRARATRLRRAIGSTVMALARASSRRRAAAAAKNRAFSCVDTEPPATRNNRD